MPCISSFVGHTWAKNGGPYIEKAPNMKKDGKEKEDTHTKEETRHHTEIQEKEVKSVI
jgi:hypothetical protein